MVDHPLSLLHNRLSVTASWFAFALGAWALVQWVRGKPLGSSFYGAALIAMALCLVQGLLGAWNYFVMGWGPVLARPWMHILYGIVAVITIPAAWSYLNGIKDERARTLAVALSFFFLWGILLRASSTALYVLPTG